MNDAAPQIEQLYQKRPLADGRVAYETGAGVDEVIDAAMAEAAPQVLLANEDLPLARVEQIFKHGHDAEYDSMLAIGHLPRVARGLIADVLDLVDGSSERRNLPVARKRLARVAAVCLAAIDRLDMVAEARG